MHSLKVVGRANVRFITSVLSAMVVHMYNCCMCDGRMCTGGLEVFAMEVHPAGQMVSYYGAPCHKIALPPNPNPQSALFAQ